MTENTQNAKYLRVEHICSIAIISLNIAIYFFVPFYFSSRPLLSYINVSFLSMFLLKSIIGWDRSKEFNTVHLLYKEFNKK